MQVHTAAPDQLKRQAPFNTPCAILFCTLTLLSARCAQIVEVQLCKARW